MRRSRSKKKSLKLLTTKRKDTVKGFSRQDDLETDEPGPRKDLFLRSSSIEYPWPCLFVHVLRIRGAVSIPDASVPIMSNKERIDLLQGLQCPDRMFETSLYQRKNWRQIYGEHKYSIDIFHCHQPPLNNGNETFLTPPSLSSIPQPSKRSCSSAESV